jgi:propionyl-CoA synthetase
MSPSAPSSDPPDDLKGQLPIGFLVLNAGVERPHEEIIGGGLQLVRDRIGAVAAFKTATVVARLPTRSRKILRATMRTIADGEQYTIPPRSTIPPSSARSARRSRRSGTRARQPGSYRCAIRGLPRGSQWKGTI